MNDRIIVNCLVCIIILLLSIVLYRQLVFTIKIQATLNYITKKISDIIENDSDEKVMFFTDSRTLKNLSGQINRLLIDRRKIKTDFRIQEIASKKMLANISHDIRTPLTVVLGYLEIMRLNNPEDEVLQIVEAKAMQVMELINQFFTLAKLEAGDLNVKITKTNINELCRENVLSFYELLIHRDFTVEISIPEQDIFVQGDKESIDRILFNLLSNAIRYGSDGNYVGVFLREENNFVYIDIVDAGKGIEKDFVNNVFDRLYTMEDSCNRKTQGNGLGLTIARKLARHMGGDILLESEPNIRTVFTVKLRSSIY